MGKFLVLLDDGHPLNEILRKALEVQAHDVGQPDEVRLLEMLGDMRDMVQTMGTPNLNRVLIRMAAHLYVWLEARHGQEAVVTWLMDAADTIEDFATKENQ